MAFTRCFFEILNLSLELSVLLENFQILCLELFTVVFVVFELSVKISDAIVAFEIPIHTRLRVQTINV